LTDFNAVREDEKLFFDEIIERIIIILV